jgi:transposase
MVPSLLRHRDVPDWKWDFQYTEMEGTEMKITRIGLDLAKDIFQVHAVDADEWVACRRQLRRGQVLDFFARLDRVEGCVVGMEACCAADYWGRELEKLGYQAKLMNPAFVKPYLKSQKNDARDAEAICEAVARPTMRFVPVKSLAQQDVLLLHRQREQLVGRRTALINQTRGLLAHYGVVVARRTYALRTALPAILEDAENALTVVARRCFAESYRELCELDQKIAQYDHELERLAHADARCQRLMSIPGVGVMTATALVAHLGDGGQFGKARQYAAYLGLVPRQHSSGGRDRLGRISKRGNRYLRTLLIHGARSVLRTAADKTDRRSRWVCELSGRSHGNKAAVALANRNARTAWALLQTGQQYRAAA